MSGSAKVNSTEALKQAKAAMAEFSDAIVTSLASVDADINRISSWLNQDRPAYWKRQVRHREEEVIKIKTEIMRKRIIAAPEPASVVDEEKALVRMQIKLTQAQARLEAVKRWAPTWDREAMMYKSSTRSLLEFLHADIPRAEARLERMLDSLEAYAKVAPPTMGDAAALTPDLASPDSAAPAPADGSQSAPGATPP